VTGFASARLIAGLAAFILAGGVAASEGGSEDAGGKDYRRLFVQGRLSEPAGGGTLAGAVVTLRNDDGVHEAVADDQGVFTFERLPVASYDMSVVTADGRVLRSGRDLERTGPTRTRLRLRFGRGDGTRLRVDPVTRDRVEVSVPEPPPDWDRFAKQGAIFAAAVVLLAL
jgi:hypothetical protein